MGGDKMSRQEDRFQALFENAPLGIIVVNREGKIILANSFALKQFGYTRGEMNNITVEQLIPETYAGGHREKRAKFMKRPQTRPMGIGLDLFAKKKDGTAFPVEISLSYYQSEEVTFVIAFISDITIRKQHMTAIEHQRDDLEKYSHEIKQLNTDLERRVEERTIVLSETLQQLQHSKDDLSQMLKREKELSDLKSRFVSMASHEFRTPLATILSSALLIEEYTKEEEQAKRQKHVKRIQDNVKNLSDILEDFLSIEKLEEGHVLVKNEELIVPDFIREIVNDVSLVKKINQKFEYNHSGSNLIVSDKHLLKNILLNLLSNAVKFSSETGLIEIKTNVDSKGLNLIVSDNGIGISKKDQEYLFDRFFRGQNASNIKGTGLGLHIIAKYIELLGGRIHCKSELNKGTQFSVLIPQSE